MVGHADVLLLAVRSLVGQPPGLSGLAHSQKLFNLHLVHLGEGLSLQLTNPKAIFFFLAVFPQFIDPAPSYATQFAALVLTYSALVVTIHSGYAFFARRAKGWLTPERGGRTVNKSAGATFVFFGAVLATAERKALAHGMCMQGK